MTFRDNHDYGMRWCVDYRLQLHVRKNTGQSANLNISLHFFFVLSSNKMVKIQSKMDMSLGKNSLRHNDLFIKR